MSISLVVLAAGMGSRYGGLKQVEAIGGHEETLLEYSLFDAIRAGFDRIVFVIRPDMEDVFIEGIFKRVSKHVDACYVFQGLDTNLPKNFRVNKERKKPWGTAHAVLSAKGEIRGAFGVINADDFYGRSAFSALGDFLREEPENHALVGYQLKNTLSSHGTVSRGVCTMDKSGYLGSIEEHTRIAVNDVGELMDWGSDGNGRLLTGNETVSLNLWGFRRSFMEFLEEGFELFLEKNGDNIKAEWYLPAEVDRGIREERFKVAVIPTVESWFGITYKEDLQEVSQAIKEKVAEGIYPRNLWEK